MKGRVGYENSLNFRNEKTQLLLQRKADLMYSRLETIEDGIGNLAE